MGKAEMCALVDSRVSQCGNNFKISGPTPAPTPPPPATCDNCRDGTNGLCLWTDGKCYQISEGVCTSQEGARYCDGDGATSARTITTTTTTPSVGIASITTSTSTRATSTST